MELSDRLQVGMASVANDTSVEGLVLHDLEFPSIIADALGSGDSELARSLLTVYVAGVEKWLRAAL